MKRSTRMFRESRKWMRHWAKQWRLAKQRRDRQGAAFALQRSITWRETAVTVSHCINN